MKSECLEKSLTVLSISNNVLLPLQNQGKVAHGDAQLLSTSLVIGAVQRFMMLKSKIDLACILQLYVLGVC